MLYKIIKLMYFFLVYTFMYGKVAHQFTNSAHLFHILHDSYFKICNQTCQEVQKILSHLSIFQAIVKTVHRVQLSNPFPSKMVMNFHVFLFSLYINICQLHGLSAAMFSSSDKLF
jgi:hypothetical protein